MIGTRTTLREKSRQTRPSQRGRCLHFSYHGNPILPAAQPNLPGPPNLNPRRPCFLCIPCICDATSSPATPLRPSPLSLSPLLPAFCTYNCEFIAVTLFSRFFCIKTASEVALPHQDTANKKLN